MGRAHRSPSVKTLKFAIGIGNTTPQLPRRLIGHGSIGPSCAIACFEGARLNLWTHSQDVFSLRAQLARVIGTAESQIIVRHLPGAGCYGHNGADDVALDAVLLARAVPGRPVRAQWSRSDELRAELLSTPMSVAVSALFDVSTYWTESVG